MNKNYIFIKIKKSIYRLLINDINYLQHDGDYIIIHHNKGRNTILNRGINLNSLGNSFIKCHRSYIINTNKIREIEITKDGDTIFLENTTSIPMSNTYKKSIINNINYIYNENSISNSK